jgi:hypothetical protein
VEPLVAGPRRHIAATFRWQIGGMLANRIIVAASVFLLAFSAALVLIDW